METNIKLPRIWNIPVGLHSSWFLIFSLLCWSLAMNYFPSEYPRMPILVYWILGIVTSLLFFVSVLAHELGHAWVALRYEIPVRSIVLFVFGGVAQIEQEPRKPSIEFKVAIAGPIVSFSLAGLFFAIWQLDQSIPFLAAPSLYLMRINLILATFNLIPGFPLDGGRVLRALVWQFSGSFQRATQIAAGTGQVFALGFIGLGILMVFQGQLMNGLWMAFIGWFLMNASGSALAQVSMEENLHGIKVIQVMNRDIIRIPSLMSLKQLVEEQVLTSGQRSFFVERDDAIIGLVTLRDITTIPQQKWRFVTVDQVMKSFERLVRVTPEVDLLSALKTMDDANIAQIPVVDGGQLVGLLSREGVLHYLRMRAELRI